MIDKKKIFISKSRTFSMASFLFNKEKFEDITNLYFICRTLDDWTDTDRNEKIIELHDAIKNKKNHFILSEYQELSNKYGLSEEPLHLMVETMIQEQNHLSINNLDELISYCKGVAGTVGWMISPIIGVKNKLAYDHAIALGITMQLTNIARDIYEDANNDRVYLPKEITGIQLTSSNILEMIESNYSKVMMFKKNLLNLAKDYYKKGEQGFKYIPIRERFVIKWASLMYYNIGVNILKNPHQYKYIKSTVPTLKRYKLLFLALFGKRIFD